MNLLMIAPLYDNKGNVRYYLGAQIDVTHLIEGGKGLESFEKLLANDRTEERYRGRSSRKPTQVLGELGAMMNKDELDAVNTRQRSESRESTSAAGSARNVTPARPARRVLGMDDSLERTLWPHPSLGPSGRLPGVYQNVSLSLYMLTVSTVPTRPPLPITTNHFYITSSAYSWLATDQTHGPFGRASRRTRRCSRQPRTRYCCHSQDILAFHPHDHQHFPPYLHRRKATLDSLYTHAGI